MAKYYINITIINSKLFISSAVFGDYFLYIFVSSPLLQRITKGFKAETKLLCQAFFVIVL